MPFKLSVSPTYQATVTVVLPGENGANQTSKFKVTLKRFGIDELEGEDGKGGLRALSQREVIKQALVGWSDLQSDDGQAVEFNDANIELLLSIPQAFKALVEAFWETQYSAREKN